jgi:short-subunit dehydrogenase
VMACVCGVVRTPGYLMAAGREAPGALDPEQVVKRALRALGRKPVVIPGFINKVAAAVMTRLLPRRMAIAILAKSTGKYAQLRETKGAS